MNKPTLLSLLARAAALLLAHNPALDEETNTKRREWLADFKKLVKDNARETVTDRSRV